MENRKAHLHQKSRGVLPRVFRVPFFPRVCFKLEIIFPFSDLYLVSLYSRIKWYTGSAGRPGATRTPGREGVKGQIGDKGSQGMPGLRGDRGREGSPGKSGPRGIKGMKGQQGLVGMKGERGIVGNQGRKGDQTKEKKEKAPK